MENLGFGKANNIGMKRAYKENADYVFLLNQDAWIESNTIKGLIEAHKNNPEYGVLSPFHLAGDGKSIDTNFSNYITQSLCNGLLSDLYLNKENMKHVYEIDYVNAAFWLISRKCLENIGGFDPLFEHYAEDNDYINRVKYHNYKIGLCPKLKGFHDRCQVNYSGKMLPKVKREYNSLLLQAKNLENSLMKRKKYIFKIFKKRILQLAHWNFSIFSSQIKAFRKILNNYSIIKKHRELCKIKQANFLE